MADAPINPSHESSPDDRLADLVNELGERLGRGEPVDIEAAIAASPQYAAQLRELWPTIRKLAEFNLTASTYATVIANGPQSPPTARARPAIVANNVVIAGRYRLLERLGEGGMGTVFAAEQTAPVRRKVAIKLIKPGMDSHQVLARFEAERQALAMMDHPNIAKVLDAALTDDGRPFFVMEYIKGVPIVEYCDAVRLTVRERLELFMPVCQAVQHAHQKGIIHRDLKPSNILVALYDDKPIPKVIDFGLAKAIHQPLIADPAYTAHEQVLGTPLYMSPEQANLNNLDIDTRTDVYALGVVLYELLTGTTPVERKRFKRAAWDEMLRIIRDEEPARPSTRLSSLDALPSLAAQRQTDPARLSRLVKGDLDWIVMKALEKDRDRRYDTATGFALDIQRHLADEPVIAGPPGVAYRTRKFIQRNRKLVLASCGFFLLLVAGIIGTAWGLISAAQKDAETKIAQAEAKTEKAEKENQQKIARLQANRALNFETFVNNLFRSADEFGFQGSGFRKEREQANELTVADLIGRAGDFVEKEFSAMPGTQADLLTVLGEVSRSQGRAQESERLLTEALRLYREQSEPPDARKVAQSLYVLGSALADQGDYDRSEQLLRESLGRLREDDPDHTRLATIVKNHLAWVLCEQGNFTEAEPLFRAAITTGNGKDNEPEWKQLLAMARIGYLSTLLALGKDQQAQQSLLAQLAAQDPSLIVKGVLVYREIAADVEARRFAAALPKLLGLLELGKKRLGADHPAIPMLLGVLADLQRKMGNFSGSEASIRESIQGVRRGFRDHPKLWEPLRELANYVASRGDFEEAEQLYRESLQIVTRRFGPANPPRFYGPAFGLHESLGRLARARGDYPAAETEFAVALDLRSAVKEPSGWLLRVDADVQMEMGHLERARAQLQIALEWFRSQNRVAEAMDARDTLVEVHRLAGDSAVANEAWQPLHDEYVNYRSFKQLRDYGPAAEAMTATVAQTRARPDAEFLELPDQLLEQASLFVRAGQGGRALPLLEESLAIYKRAFGPDFAIVRNIMLELAKAQDRIGDSQAAEMTAREACRLREERLGRSHLWTADALADLAALLSRRGEHDEAILLLTETLDLRKSKLPATHSLVWKNSLDLAAVKRLGGDHRGAAAGLQEALSSLVGLLPPGSYRLAELHSALAESLFELGETVEAERLLLSAYARQAEDVRDLCTGRDTTRLRLLKFYRAQNKPDEAAKFLDP